MAWNNVLHLLAQGSFEGVQGGGILNISRYSVSASFYGICIALAKAIQIHM